MKTSVSWKCVLFALVAFNSLAIMAQTTQQAAKPEKKFLQPERVRYDGSCMTIEGKDIFIYSAAFHYFRCPEELWRDRFPSNQGSRIQYGGDIRALELA